MKKQSYAQIMQYAGNRKYLLYTSWILSAFSAGMALIPIYYIWKIIYQVLEKSSILILYDWSYDARMAVLFAFLSIVLYSISLICSHKAAFYIASGFKNAVMRHISGLSLEKTSVLTQGQLRMMCHESAAVIEKYFAHQLPERAGTLAVPPGLLLLLFLWDWRLGCFSLPPVLLTFLLLVSVIGFSTHRDKKEFGGKTDNILSLIEKFRQFQESYSTWIIGYARELSTPILFYSVLLSGGMALLIGIGFLISVDTVNLLVGAHVIFYVIITPMISLTLLKILFTGRNAGAAGGALERMYCLLQVKPFFQPKQKVQVENYSVALENVSFYGGKKNFELKNLSFTVHPGQTLAVLGPAEGGKFILAGLLAHLLQPSQGRILIGGKNLSDFTGEQLKKMISFVFQENKLEKISILENVRLAKPQAGREEILEVLEETRCMEWIGRLPHGADTVIGEKGFYLSRGEQQCLALARARLKDAPVWVLDEAEIAFDMESEMRISSVLSRFMQNKTVIVFARRVVTAASADQVLVLNSGEMAEHGKLRDLIGQRGIYARFIAKKMNKMDILIRY